MPHNAKAIPHFYDYGPIFCECGYTLGYRETKSTEPLKCVDCDAVHVVRPANAPVVDVQPLLDAIDNACALRDGHGVAIKFEAWTAIVQAREALKGAV